MKKLTSDAGTDDVVDILDQILNDPSIPDELEIVVSLPVKRTTSDDEDEDPILDAYFERGRRDLEESIRIGMREEMDIVAQRRFRTPHKLDMARQKLRELAVEAGVVPDEWLARLESEHYDIGPVLEIVDSECRLELTNYRSLADAAAVIPATVPDHGLVVMFEGKELRARNGRRFHKRPWTDYLDEGMIGKVRASDGGMSNALQSIIGFLPGYSRNLRKWNEI